MGYLNNRTINHLNIHAALLTLLEQANVLFAPIYFYQLGFSLPEVFLLLAVLNGARIPLRLLTFPVVRLFGLKAGLIIGTAGFCLTFPIMAMTQGYDIWLAVYIIMFGIFCSMYWHCYHTFYSLAGEHEHRGKHISVAMSLSAGVSAIAPLLGSLFITSEGFGNYFLLAVPILVVMICILSGCQDIKINHRIKWKQGKKLIFSRGARIHIAEASAYYPMNISWLFLIYFYVGKLAILGGIMTFGIIVQVIYQLWIGKIIDSGRGKYVAHIAGGLRLAQVLGRVFLPLSIPRVLGLEALSATANVHHSLAQPTVMYNTGKSSADAFWYWLFAETAFDIGTIIGAGSAALLLMAGVPLNFVILLALPGVLAVWRLTAHYFKA